MVDELKTDKMESFVGNDARAMYNIVLHVLGVKIPYRLRDINSEDPVMSEASDKVGQLLDKAWRDINRQFRHTGPRQDIDRTINGFMLSTGWYCVFAPLYDDGSRAYAEPWNPIDVYPVWNIEFGLAEVGHITKLSAQSCNRLMSRNSWGGASLWKVDQETFDYWWIDGEDWQGQIVWNAVVIGNELVKFEPTRFNKIPIYIAPVGGLPDTGSLSEGSDMSSHTYNAGGKAGGERWKEEIGQAVIATNEHIYKTWNKWWTFSLQLLRDTAQPKIFEKSRSGKAIVKPDEVFKRGIVWRGGPEDSVDFVTPPSMPLELRSNQLDLEAMMQRGGFSWSVYGATQGDISAYVMSQIAASAGQVISPFKKARENLYEDIANDWLQDIIDRGINPYSWKRPKGLTDDSEVEATFEVEIPGDMVQRLTAARMADPDFRLSYTYVLEKLFPDIRDRAKEKARILADGAAVNPINGLIALVQYHRQQAEYLTQAGDYKTAELYQAAAEAETAQLKAMGNPQQQEQRPIGTRTEGAPPSMTGGM